MWFRRPAAAQTAATPTARSVLSVPSVPDTPSQPLRVRRRIPQPRSRSGPKAPGRPPRPAFSNETSTTAPSAAWAAPKLFVRLFRSSSSPARRPFRPLWFRRTSIWRTTGWRMIWVRCSRRRRDGFEWILTSQDGRKWLRHRLEVRII